MRLVYRYIWIESDEPTNEYFYETTRRGRRYRVYLARQREYYELAPVEYEQEYFESEPERREYIEQKRKLSEKKIPKKKPLKKKPLKKVKKAEQKKRPPTKRRPVRVKERVRKPTAKPPKIVKGVTSVPWGRYINKEVGKVHDRHKPDKTVAKTIPPVKKIFSTGFMGDKRPVKKKFNWVTVWFWSLWQSGNYKNIIAYYININLPAPRDFEYIESIVPDIYAGVKVGQTKGDNEVVGFIGFQVENKIFM